MADFFEIDFLPVHTAKSGDAIAIRYQVGTNSYVHLVDGGYGSTAPVVAEHIRKYYEGTNLINNVVVTHPDKDHAEGLAPIIREFRVERLWMLRPWMYANELLPHFSRYSSVQNLINRLRDEYPYIAELERIAVAKNIPISEPLQGAQIGPFRVLAPSIGRYLRLVIKSDKTPQQGAASSSVFDRLFEPLESVTAFVKAGWGSENFSSEETSAENEMSVIQFLELDGQKVLLTGDAGRDGMTEAADFAPTVGLSLPGINKLQAPHHGGRRNLSTAVLDRWVGPRLSAPLPEGTTRFTAMISSAKEDKDHPRKAVERALWHRGAFVATTEEGSFSVFSNNAPKRGWPPLKNRPYPDEQEA